MTTDWRALCAELLQLAGSAQSIAVGEGLWDGDEDEGLLARARAALAEPVGEGLTDEELLDLDQLRDAWNAQADAMNSWDELGVDEIICWAQRQVLARYGHQPAPPAEGEVGEGPTPSDEELLKLARAELNNSPNWEEPEYDASNPFPYEAPGIAWLNFARAVLARFGHQPAPAPAEGEVAELVEWLRRQASKWDVIDREAGLTRSLVAEHFTRAADLLEHRQSAPVPVAERLPGPEDCDAEGRCWWLHVGEDGVGDWFQRRPYPSTTSYTFFRMTHWLPATALPLPAGEGEK